jgi:hypothetical protein
VGWCETRGRGGAMGSERADGSVSATRNALDRDVRCGLCEQAHVSVLVMMVVPEVLMVTMMMAIVLMMIAAHPAVGVEHS